MTSPLNCTPGDLAFVKPSAPGSHLHDRIVEVIVFMGKEIACPCCEDKLKNVWMVVLQGEPVRTPVGPVRLVALEDQHLRPIRSGGAGVVDPVVPPREVAPA